ncbi:MAG TPA: Spy/CpxP family protein refolding chaperone [Stellaceae bacterium]|nr:Spy/CpxP family protein refolding chaperone [Stellaceae bacterium]
MIELTHPAARGLSAAALLAAALLVGTAAATAADRPATALLLAQATQAPAQPAAPAMNAAPAKPSWIDKKIDRLHAQLKITPAQATQWQAVADAMRADAESVEPAYKERKAATNAVDDLKAYQATVEAHAKTLPQLVSAFATLYDSMSPEQKTNADAVFGHHHRRHHPAAKSGAAKPSAQ